MWSDIVDFLVVVLPTVIAVLSVIVSIKLTKGESHKVWWANIIALGIFTSVMTGLSQSSARKAHAAEVNDLHGKLEYVKGQLEQENATLSTVTHDLSTAIQQSQLQFETVMGKTNRVLANITGGDSFGFVVPQPWGEQIPLAVWNHGREPLSGVTLTIARTQEPDWASDFFKPIFIGTIGPHTFAPVPVVLVPRPEEKSGQDHYWIMISAQNGTVSESLYFRKNKKGVVPWAYSYLVTKNVPASKAKMRIPVGVPKNATVNEPVLQRRWSDEVDEPH